MKNFDSIVSVTETQQMFWNVDGPCMTLIKDLDVKIAKGI